MRNYWDMDEEVVVEILKKARLLAREEREFVLSVLMDYYECADKGFGWKGFDKVERKRFPHLKEEERLMPTMEFGFERAERQGREQGIEQKCHEAVTRMLTRGMPEEQIMDVLQLTAEQLEKIKQRLKQS